MGPIYKKKELNLHLK